MNAYIHFQSWKSLNILLEVKQLALHMCIVSSYDDVDYAKEKKYLLNRPIPVPDRLSRATTFSATLLFDFKAFLARLQPLHGKKRYAPLINLFDPEKTNNMLNADGETMNEIDLERSMSSQVLIAWPSEYQRNAARRCHEVRYSTPIKNTNCRAREVRPYCDLEVLSSRETENGCPAQSDILRTWPRLR